MPIGFQGKKFTKEWLLKFVRLMDEKAGFDTWGEDISIEQCQKLDDLDMLLLDAERKSKKLIQELA